MNIFLRRVRDSQRPREVHTVQVQVHPGEISYCSVMTDGPRLGFMYFQPSSPNLLGSPGHLPVLRMLACGHFRGYVKSKVHTQQEPSTH